MRVNAPQAHRGEIGHDGHEALPGRPVRPGDRGGHGLRPAGHRPGARPSSTAATCATGPNPMGRTTRDYHWFIGDGMVHGVRLRDGRAEWYRNRWVRVPGRGGGARRGRGRGPVHDGMDFARRTPTSIAIAGRTLAIVESGPLPYELTDELDTHRPVRLRRHTARRLHRAHQARPGDRASSTRSPTSGPGTTCSTWSSGPTARCARTTDVAVADGPMMHDFALTRALRRAARPPGDVQPRRRAAGQGAAVHVEHEPPGPRRPAATRRQLAGRALDRHRAVLRVPHAQRVRRRRSRRVVLDVCRYEQAYDVSAAPRPAGRSPSSAGSSMDPAAGKVDDRAARRPAPGVPANRRPAWLGRPHRYGYTAVIGEGSWPRSAVEQGGRPRTTRATRC